ncbi:hypothetical protein EJ04DRAFT_606324 [Polyplosphaeria fusca]|uniref:Uncharacterized protein n=1 Tax=Polyplosphaeria fusca TaxID=682080 RepID=A0A9P4RAE3_9PLEO|nr:hypothetical protein EJ04DRAFT_606324 [Polyplosphaeria fusca]
MALQTVMIRMMTLFVIFIAVLPVCLGQQHLATGEDADIDADLASALQHTSYKQQELLSQALQIVHSMESAPTCNRLAALNLINDCKSLEQAGTDAKSKSETILDEVKSEYAARLAVCEILGAKATVPRDCTILVPSAQACVKTRFRSFFSRQDTSKKEYCYPESTRPHFERCLRALVGTPQSWTSYSNARQNAVVMCHATRDAIERDNDIATYKTLAEVVNQMITSLKQSGQEMETKGAEQVRLAEKIRESQEQALQAVQVNSETTQSTLKSIISGFRSFAGMMDQATDALSQSLNETLTKSKEDIEQTREQMTRLYRDMATMSSQHAAMHQQELQANHESALANLHENREVAEYGVSTLSSRIYSLQDQIDSSSDKLQNVNQELDNLGKKVGDIGIAAEGLESAIEKTTQAFQVLASLGGWLSNPALCLAILGCFLGFWMSSRKVAGYVFALFGFCYLIYALGMRERLHNLNANTLLPAAETLIEAATRVPPLIWITLALVLIWIVSIAVWAWASDTYLSELEDDQGEKGIFPSIETPNPPMIASPQRRSLKQMLSNVFYF